MRLAILHPTYPACLYGSQGYTVTVQDTMTLPDGSEHKETDTFTFPTRDAAVQFLLTVNADKIQHS